MVNYLSHKHYVKRANHIAWPAILALFIVFVWCIVNGLTSFQAWTVPLAYDGDALLVLANAKAYLDGDITLLLPKWVAHLNAPFSANWNDWPIAEEVIYAIIGWLGRLTGLFTASNLVVLSCHVFAGLSFWAVGRALGCCREYVFLGAMAYALSPYAFSRGLGHLVLTMYWHLPWLILISWRVMRDKPFTLEGKQGYVAIAVSALAGMLNPYYCWIYIQFLGFALLKHWLRRDARAFKGPAILLSISIGIFFIFNLDTLWHTFLAGKNLVAVERNLAALELYGLKLPELFLPLRHRWQAFEDFSGRNYFSRILIKGEGTAYIGIIGVGAFFWLVGVGLFRILKKENDKIPTAWWQVVWIISYSLIGGTNLVLGSLGLVLFRGTNRYSIVILTLVLISLAQILSKRCPGNIGRSIAILIIPLVLWDQLPSIVSAETRAATIKNIEIDRQFAKKIEESLPAGGMVFQLPIMDYPEVPPIEKMGDYEHFRPYLFTSDLHYSYGTTKGRPDAIWQHEIYKSSPDQLVKDLENYGFSAIIVNRKGYADGGNKMINEIISVGRNIFTENPDMVLINLTPVGLPVFPILPLGIQFKDGWSSSEGGHRWAISQRATIILNNPGKTTENATISFSLHGLRPQKIDILINREKEGQIFLQPGNDASFVKKLSIPPGNTLLEIISDTRPESPGGDDMRKLTFNIFNYKFSYQ